MNVGTKVKIQKVYQPWLRKFNGKTGVIKEIKTVHPSKRVKDGLVYDVWFNIRDRRTDKIGVTKSFITKELLEIT